MELHEALKNIINTDGPEIIKDLKLVNILDDFKAYDKIPASKYMMRAIIVDGYTSKLLKIGDWNTESITLSSYFSSKTGFIPENVYLLFQSLAYGLGWISNFIEDDYSSYIHNPPQKNMSGTISNNRNPIPTKWRSNMTEDEIDCYFLSLTELDRSKDNVFGVNIENLCYFVNSNNNITLSCEVTRTNNQKDYAFLRYVLYDTKRRAVSTGMGTGKSPNTPNPNPVFLEFNLPPSMISKIRLYWE